MSALWIALIGALLVAIALLGRFLERLPVSGAVIYLLIGVVLGPAAFDAFEIHPLRHLAILEPLAQVALIVAVFAAGIRLRIPMGDERWSGLLRLATFSTAATVLGITLLAWLLFGFSLGLALVLGAALAPTDPVLASELKWRGEDGNALRSVLAGEGALNVGFAFPFALLGLGVLGNGDTGFSLLRWLTVDLLWSVPVGVGVGFFIGATLATAVRALRTGGGDWVMPDPLLLSGVIALSYGVAQAVHAIGFLAVFAAGVAFRLSDEAQAPARATDESPQAPALSTSLGGVSEPLERVAEVAIMILVGVMISTGYWSMAGLGIALVLFLVIRPLSIYAAIPGVPSSGVPRRLLGWFGLRGIGSFYYAIFAVNLGSDEILYADAEKLLSCIFTVIAASVVLHGVFSPLLMTGYQRQRSRGRARTSPVSDK